MMIKETYSFFFGGNLFNLSKFEGPIYDMHLPRSLEPLVEDYISRYPIRDEST